MPYFLDLFAGAGGLSEGFIQAGYTPVAHVEMDEAACYTLKTRAAYHWLSNHGQPEVYDQYLQGEMTRDEFYHNIPENVLSTVLNYEISEETLPEIFQRIDRLLNGEVLDLIIGGPPCQAYSIAGRSRSENKMVGDHRNYLYKLYAEFLDRYQPRYFVFENVTGLLSAKDEDGTFHFRNMIDLFAECGYRTEYKVLNAREYGVLQNRKRIILIGALDEEDTQHYPDIPRIQNNGINVNELFADLPFLHAGEGTPAPVPTLPYHGRYLYESGIKQNDLAPVTFHVARPHIPRDLAIYKIAVKAWNSNHRRISYQELPEPLQTHKNKKEFLDRFKVVAGDLPSSQTVVAHISRDGHYYIHPDIEQNRSLTPREAARLQTFPDNYYFESRGGKPSRTLAYKQIGNAVPVRLAFCVANAMLPFFDDPEHQE